MCLLLVCLELFNSQIAYSFGFDLLQNSSNACRHRTTSFSSPWTCPLFYTWMGARWLGVK